MNKTLDERQLKALCTALAETNQGLIKTEITRLLGECKIVVFDDGGRTIDNGMHIKSDITNAICCLIILSMNLMLKEQRKEFLHLLKKH